MANEFQTVASGGGILKNTYDTGEKRTPLSEALRRKLKKQTDDKFADFKPDEPKDDAEY